MKEKVLLLVITLGCMAICACNTSSPKAEQVQIKDTVVPSFTAESTAEITDAKEDIGLLPMFAISNTKTNELLVISHPDNEDSKLLHPEYYTYAIYKHKFHKIKYLGVQKEDEKNNTMRDTPYNFENFGGYHYQLVNGALDREEIWDAVLLVDDQFEKSSKILKSTTLKEMSASLKSKLEAQYRRKITKVAACATLGDNAEYTFFAVQFKNREKSALAVVGLVTADGKLIVKDEPAEYDATSTWHVDDGGEYYFNMKEALLINGKINLITSDSGGESTNMYNLEIVSDSLKLGNISVSLYQAPL